MKRRQHGSRSATPATRATVRWKSSRWSPLRSRLKSSNVVLAAVALFGLALLVSVSARADAGITRDRGPSRSVAVLTGGPRTPAVAELTVPRPGHDTLLRGEGTPTPTTVASPHLDGPSWDPSPASLLTADIVRVYGERRPAIRKVVRR